jgi:antitoxin ParD1/3/4
MTLNVSLIPYLEAFVRQAVSSGRYRSASELVRTALRLLEERERGRVDTQERLQREIRQGFDSGPVAVPDLAALHWECHAECFNVNDVLARRGKIALIWSFQDVLEVRPHLTATQAWEVVRHVGHQHDPALGVTWETLEQAAHDLFGPTPDPDAG